MISVGSSRSAGRTATSWWPSLLVLVITAAGSNGLMLRTRHKDQFEGQAEAMFAQHRSLEKMFQAASTKDMHADDDAPPANQQALLSKQRLRKDAANFDCLHLGVDCVPQVGQRSSGTSIFLGKLAGVERCRTACHKQGDCMSFTFFSKGELSLQCFGHLTTEFRPRSHTGATTGLIQRADPSSPMHKLRKLFYKPCKVGQPIQLHTFRSTALGNEITQVLTSLHVAITHNRPLVFSSERKFIWFGSYSNQQYDLAELFRLSSCQMPYQQAPSAWPQSAIFSFQGKKGTGKGFGQWSYPGHPRELAHSGKFWGSQPSASSSSRNVAYSQAPYIAWWKTMTAFMLRPSDKLLQGSVASAHTITHHPDGSMGRDLSLANLHNHTQYQNRLLGMVDRARLRRSCAGPIVGIHMRNGDACKLARYQVRPACVKNITHVMSAIVRAHTVASAHSSWSGTTASTDEARAGTGKSLCVLLATDSAEVSREAAALASKLGVRVYINSFGRAAYSTSGTFMEDRQHMNRATVLHQSLADMALLASADVHVGSFYGNFRRVAYQLAPLPALAYWSFDAKWCPFTSCFYGWGAGSASEKQWKEYWSKGIRRPMPSAILPFYKLMDHFAVMGGISGENQWNFRSQWAGLSHKMKNLWR
jgi:hypothetical protein